MKQAILPIMLAVSLTGCGRSSGDAITDKLVGVWQMDKVTTKDREFTAEQHLKKDGTFEMRGTVPIPTGPITFVVHGTWRADADHLYQTATNSAPILGLPLNREETYTLLSVGSSKFTIRTADRETRTFRRKK